LFVYDTFSVCPDSNLLFFFLSVFLSMADNVVVQTRTFDLQIGWSHSLDKPATGSIYKIAWSADGTQVPLLPKMYSNESTKPNFIGSEGT
jgi:hypothetical protein